MKIEKLTPDQLEDKIEGNFLALQATIDEKTKLGLARQIKVYATKYREVTGKYYFRNWKD